MTQNKTTRKGKTMLSAKRKLGIESGVANAVDTVCEKAQTREWVWAHLDEFVSDGLNCHQLNDIPTAEDMAFARMSFPI